MWALPGCGARFGTTRRALLRAVLAGVAARCWRRSATRGLLLPLWLRSAEGLLLGFHAPRRRAGGGTASNGAAVSILEGTSIGPKDEFSGGVVAGAAGLPMRISS
ncbi:hypothetical protein CORTU0001_2127 [Corynebacterium tuberculostearicum SK141]|uniref:Uncharacterized protein n=1 Tax=Corynebacterium tuberculostearicum SK141 TaxID=553206 RepID=C6R7F3_9CORY|nr:hypothetical protein CORTU0001_2127 [Corynebacterium tuberculostearicum SK141]